MKKSRSQIASPDFRSGLVLGEFLRRGNDDLASRAGVLGTRSPKLRFLLYLVDLWLFNYRHVALFPNPEKR